MTLTQAIAAAGMTPPADITPGRWFRFPGVDKKRSNRAGWCRLITPTLAIYGDWSTGLSEVWRDNTHRDDSHSRRALEEARKREAEFSKAQKERQAVAAGEAQRMISSARPSTHPYLERKGFPHLAGLVAGAKLLVPMRDVIGYNRIMSVQEIWPDGMKRFIPGGRTRGGIYRLGAPTQRARRIALCEGYATGLSLDAALQRLPGPHSVVVCFSAFNLAVVAERFPEALVCADNDESKTGEMAALKTGLQWVMPPEVGTDFNDMHQRQGLAAVVETLRVRVQP